MMMSPSAFISTPPPSVHARSSSSFLSPLSSRSRVATSPVKPCQRVVVKAAAQSLAGKRVLVIGGTRFSGLYLVEALASRGAEVVVLNRGSKAIGDESLRIPGESDEAFAERNGRTSGLIADRTNEEQLKDVLSGEKFDVIYDNNGRELPDSKMLIDMAKDMKAHFVYMSSAGVYKKSAVMPHIEGDEVDLQCRHKGKLNTELYLRESGVTWTAIRPTYIYGAGNYNPLEQWFFERLDQNRPICIPGHGMHLTGLGHVRDLVNAMALCANEEKAFGQVFNIQDRKAVTFDGVARLCAEAMGKNPDDIELIHYDVGSVDFGKKKAFPFRPQHFFTSCNKALRQLDWEVEWDLKKGLKDAYENDFLIKKEKGGLKNDFSTDELVLESVRPKSMV